jgi:hypothetical protein
MLRIKIIQPFEGKYNFCFPQVDHSPMRMIASVLKKELGDILHFNPYADYCRDYKIPPEVTDDDS